MRTPLTAVLAAALVSVVPAQENETWTRPVPPVRIVGNLYYVGTYDVWVASHASQFGLHEKAARVGGAERFVDPEGYRTAVDRLERAYLDQLENERGAR